MSDPEHQNQNKQSPLHNTHSDDTAYNWYAKLHPIGKDSTAVTSQQKPEKILNLSLFFRIWIAVGIIVVISGIVVFNQLFNYVRPITQQVIEDTLVDTSMLLAASLQSAVESGEIYDEQYQRMLDRAFLTSHSLSKNLATDTAETARSATNSSETNNHSIKAPNKPQNTPNPKNYHLVSKEDSANLNTSIPAPWYHEKTYSSFRVYVTDADGKVIYDSLPKAVHNNAKIYSKTKSDDSINHIPDMNAEGQDYSKWNDINLTLQGKYGARTTRKDPNDPTTSIMYVAQPIYAADSRDIIGVVSVGKPTATILPYLDATRERMLTASFMVSVVTLIMAGLIAWWLRQSILLVTRYTQSLAQDTKKPYFYLGSELNELTDTIESMKHRLENRAYVTDYVHTLTHELKSPLTAIRASGELLEEDDLDNEDRQMLSQTITEQSIKLQSLIDRLLLLAKIEQPTFKLSPETIHPDILLKKLIHENEMQRQLQKVEIIYQNKLPHADTHLIWADEFWMTQALQNVLDNALYFAHSQVTIVLTADSINSKPFVNLSIINDGDLIPDYALNKVFDRYFSLSHQYSKPLLDNSNHQGKKGTGLGLTLVKQVIERHGGTIEINNSNLNEDNVSGVIVSIYLPASQVALTD